MGMYRTAVVVLTVVFALVSWRTSHAFNTYKNRCTINRKPISMAIFEGNPIGLKIWNTVWKFPFMQPSEQGKSPTSFGDAANVLKQNILQMYGGEPSYDGAPVAEGEIDGLLEGSLFLGLQSYFEKVS